ncbi:methylthioadenosine phosphorylase [Frankineae bacterium MT45]|nr:methylthioadenosine phosphorylase [Frankineae bacterium MT45]
MTNSDLADIGVIGGSGFYSLLSDARPVAVTTPFGEPSAELTVGTFAGRRVAFLPRHGADHRFAPHLVPYRANLWALRSVGVRQVVSLSAVGSLKAELGAGTLVVPDQLVDRTHGRATTFVADGAGVAHISLADPYCARGRAAALRSEAAVTDGGVLVVVNGPRFSTRAESLEFQSHGWSIIGMTGMPEAILARELALCYTTLALVTDLDAGVEAGGGVTHGEVLAAFARNLPLLRDLLADTLTNLPDLQGDCACAAVYSDMPPPYELP